MKKEYSFECVFPTSPDGTDWGIYGDTLREQWLGVWFEAADFNALRNYALRKALAKAEKNA